jgi:hypothetical protein
MAIPELLLVVLLGGTDRPGGGRIAATVLAAYLADLVGGWKDIRERFTIVSDGLPPASRPNASLMRDVIAGGGMTE